MITIVQWWLRARDKGFSTATQLFNPMVHLVGNKSDIRQSCSGGTANCPGGLFHSCCVTVAEATATARSIQADRYVECSALTGHGMETVLDESVAEATRRAISRAVTRGDGDRNRG
ncbi:hypothetical protein GQ602_003754 [Ophiocordyceps camponoti-floridani]|uniref:Uncharacterized protein n=1 Tax=Ophiocordyceps camponoti-floridani TaxID=2030778 RepID=A0A8H4Q8T2_9HYPO|nr:hypothetical protein GQ602_003754 [Ophiocordyceps camponoti-floridani]